MIKKRLKFSAHIRQLLFDSFEENRYPDASEKERLVKQTSLSLQQLNTWFINARARYKSNTSENEENEETILPLLLDWFDHHSFDVICAFYGDYLHTQWVIREFLNHTFDWRHLLFCMDYLELDLFEHFAWVVSACQRVVKVHPRWICLDLMYHSVLTQKYVFAHALLCSGVEPSDLSLPNGQRVGLLELVP